MAIQDLTVALTQPIPPMLDTGPNDANRALQRLLLPTKKKVGPKQSDNPTTNALLIYSSITWYKLVEKSRQLGDNTGCYLSTHRGLGDALINPQH